MEICTAAMIAPVAWLLFACVNLGESADSTLWHVRVFTSDLPEAGTDAAAYIQIYGTEGHTEPLLLDVENYNDNEAGNMDEHQFNTNNVGEPKKLKVWLTSYSDAWHPQKIELQQDGSDQVFIYKINGWLGNGLIKEVFIDTGTLWHVRVFTSDLPYAGTDGAAYIQIYGTEGHTEPLPLDVENYNDNEAGNMDEHQFVINNVGDRKSFRVWLTTSSDPWHPEKIEVQQDGSDQVFIYNINRWLGNGKTKEVFIDNGPGPGDCPADPEKCLPNSSWKCRPVFEFLQSLVQLAEEWQRDCKRLCDSC